jgi:urease accessory protein UreF
MAEPRMKEALHNQKLDTPAQISLLGEIHPLLQQLGSCDGLTDFSGYSELMAGAKVRDLNSLRRFLDRYQEHVLASIEFPIIISAHAHARQNQARELVALDNEVRSQKMPQDFARASQRVGQGHLQRLRPLRDQRVVQRYLSAVDAGEACGWHTIVYGVTLALYSLPLRQGLILYARQTLEGFVRAAARPLGLAAAECNAMIDTLCDNVPKLVEHVLQQQGATAADL